MAENMFRGGNRGRSAGMGRLHRAVAAAFIALAAFAMLVVYKPGFIRGFGYPVGGVIVGSLMGYAGWLLLARDAPRLPSVGGTFLFLGWCLAALAVGHHVLPVGHGNAWRLPLIAFLASVAGMPFLVIGVCRGWRTDPLAARLVAILAGAVLSGDAALHYARALAALR